MILGHIGPSINSSSSCMGVFSWSLQP